VRAQRFETQLETILDRDLRLLQQTTLSLRSLRQLLAELAHQQGAPLEWASLSRRTRISAPTLRKLIAALESMFLIRLLPSKGTEKKPAVFFEDQGEATHLAPSNRTALGDLTRFLFAQLRPQVAYRPESRASLFQLRNRGGAYVPLCGENSDGVRGIIPFLEHVPLPHDLATARGFLKRFPSGKVLFCGPEGEDRMLTSNIRVVGLGQLV
jgi:predicted AAA+ superfamily ATPase